MTEPQPPRDPNLDPKTEAEVEAKAPSTEPPSETASWGPPAPDRRTPNQPAQPPGASVSPGGSAATGTPGASPWRVGLSDRGGDTAPPRTPPGEPPSGLPSAAGDQRFKIATIVLAVLTLFFALMTLAPGVMPFKLGAAKTASQVDADDEVASVASRFAERLLTFNYKTLRRDLDNIAELTTGEFKRQFTGVEAISPDVVAAEAVSSGEVTDVGVTFRDDESARAIVKMARTIDNKNIEEPRTQDQILEVSLAQTSSGWKVDAVKDLTGLNAVQ